jgi:hypothetical protein
MTITYTWNFYPLETKPVDGSFVDVVTNVHYQLHGVDDETGARSSNIGVASLSAANAEDFTAFADLTEDKVKGWVLAALVEQFPSTGEEDKSVTETPDQVEARLKENIANNIRRLNNPPIVKRAAPWGVVSEL